MLRRAAAAAVVLAGALTPAVYADDGPTVGNDPGCRGSLLSVTVCASDGAGAGGSPGSAGSSGTKPASGGGKADDGPKCTYTRYNPQPTPEKLKAEFGVDAAKGDLYRAVCPDSAQGRQVWVPTGTDAPAAPTIDPEAVARRAVDSMRLAGPDVASPRAAGKYVVGMPMWMWVEQGPTTYGPNTASATAGGVTVTATAKVSSITWTMGDGATVTCNGPGTPYAASQGKADSPDCGHRYALPSTGQKGGTYRGTATATWGVEWEATGVGDAGQFTETRTSPFAVDVREVQVLNPQ